MSGIRRFIKRHNMELQFWGYEGGNVLATIAGAGGFGAFAGKVGAVVEDSQLSALQKWRRYRCSIPMPSSPSRSARSWFWHRWCGVRPRAAEPGRSI